MSRFGEEQQPMMVSPSLQKEIRSGTSYLAWCNGATIVITSLGLLFIAAVFGMSIFILSAVVFAPPSCPPAMKGGVAIPGFGGRCYNTTDCPLMYKCGPNGACIPETNAYAALTACTNKKDCDIVGTRPSSQDYCCSDGFCTHNGVCDVVVDDGNLVGAVDASGNVDAAVSGRAGTGCDPHSSRCQMIGPRDYCCGPHGDCVVNTRCNGKICLNIPKPDYICSISRPGNCHSDNKCIAMCKSQCGPADEGCTSPCDLANCCGGECRMTACDIGGG